MGCSYSSCEVPLPPGCVRVIRITGHVEDLRAPVTAGEITGRPPKHVLFSGTHLAAFGSNPLRPDDLLEPGRVYFLLPEAIIRSASSAVDLAILMSRLQAASAHRAGPSSLSPAAKPDQQRLRAWKPELNPIVEQSVERAAAVARGRSSKRQTGKGDLPLRPLGCVDENIEK